MSDFSIDGSNANILSEDNVNAAFGAAFADESPATTPADEQPAATEEEDEETEDDEAPGLTQAPQPAGDIKAALKQEREKYRIERERATAAEQRLAAIEQQHQQQAYQAQLAQDLEQLHPDDVPAYLQAKQYEQQQQMQAQYQQEQAQRALAMSEEYARQTFPDYDAQISKMLTAFGPSFVQWAQSQPNPAMAAYQKAQSFSTPEEVEARVQAAREEERAQYASPKQQQLAARRPAAPPSVRNLPVGAKNPDINPASKLLKSLEAGSNSGDFDATVRALFGG